jgi:integrase
MASLVKRGGTYYAQFYDGTRHPERKRLSLKTTRKTVARRRLAGWEEDYELGRFDPWLDDPWSYDEEPMEALSVKQATDRFLEEKKATGRSENTLRTYRGIFDLLLQAVDPTAKIASLSSGPLQSLIWDPELADATKHKRYGHLRTLFRWCVQQNVLEESPLEAVTKPQKPDKFPKAITPGELERLCTALRRDYRRKREKNWIREGEIVWRLPLFWFAYYTGMRGAELARLRWKHIDADRRLIYIREQKNRKEQTIPLNAKARAVLREVGREDVPEAGEEANRDAYVFTSPGFDRDTRSARNFRERAAETFRKGRTLTAEADDLETVPQHLSFHSLRHGFCTALAEAGKSAAVIKEAARHADIQTSMRYVHMANETLKTEVEDAFGE